MSKKKGIPVVKKTDIVTVKMEGMQPQISVAAGEFRAVIKPESIEIIKSSSFLGYLTAWGAEGCEALTALMAQAAEAYKWLSLLK